MGQIITTTDFQYKYDDEPHATRRKEILAKHPEIKNLFGPDPYMKYLVPLIVIFQLVTAYYVIQLPGWAILFLSWALAGTFNHNLSLAMHEISHNLAFGHSSPMMNRFIGFVANIPLCVPSSITFKKYHLDHHRYQGDNKLDVDIPSHLEGYLFYNTFTKLIWVFLQPLFYSFRPLFVHPKPVETLEIANTLWTIGWNYLIYNFIGGWALAYLAGGTLLGLGLHPMAGHFISEHYTFIKGQETYSYYGPLNWLAWNVGYHNEHHDFPYVSWSRLPKVKEIAPEYYTMPSYSSWSWVIYKYITDPEIGPYSRVKRGISSPAATTGDDKKAE